MDYEVWLSETVVGSARSDRLDAFSGAIARVGGEIVYSARAPRMKGLRVVGLRSVGPSIGKKTIIATAGASALHVSQVKGIRRLDAIPPLEGCRGCGGRFSCICV